MEQQITIEDLELDLDNKEIQDLDFYDFISSYINDILKNKDEINSILKDCFNNSIGIRMSGSSKNHVYAYSVAMNALTNKTEEKREFIKESNKIELAYDEEINKINSIIYGCI